MNFLEAILLGVVQGLTEFLPISSSAHLTLAGNLLGLINPSTAAAWTAFVAVIQLGTLIAVIVYFFKDLLLMVSTLRADWSRHGFSADVSRYSLHTRLAIFMIAGTIPMALIGLGLSGVIHSMFTKSTSVIASSLIGLALLLWLAERVASHRKKLDELTLLDAIIIGTAQALALIPGSSRSGTTLTAGLFLNMTREAAARFSFLLSIPAIGASGLYELMKVKDGIADFGMLNVAAATAVSALVGYASIAWLLRFLLTNTTISFVVYRIALGCLLFALLHFGIMQF